MKNSTITPGETRRRISYDLKVVEFVSPAQNLVIVEHPADGRRFVHTYDEVASWPIVKAAPGWACPVCDDDAEWCPSCASEPSAG